MNHLQELIQIELINSIGLLRSFSDRDEATRNPEMDWSEVTSARIVKLLEGQYVPFVSEVEEFNALMNKPNTLRLSTIYSYLFFKWGKRKNRVY